MDGLLHPAGGNKSGSARPCNPEVSAYIGAPNSKESLERRMMEGVRELRS